MKQIQFQATYYEYNDLLEFSLEDQNLINNLDSLLKKAYAPYSGFKVAAIVKTVDGRVFEGVNMENASYPVCICAEGAGLTAYNSSGSNTPIEKVMIMARHDMINNSSFAAPCGACRQMLLEFENKQSTPIQTYLCHPDGRVLVINSVKDLIPIGFTKSNLDTE